MILRLASIQSGFYRMIYPRRVDLGLTIPAIPMADFHPLVEPWNNRKLLRDK
jgi:hypothetical protein